VSGTERIRAALADRYRIERELGQGGMATVYLAQDLRHNRQVAIKVLRPELAAVLGAERFVQEIQTTAALSHPHILPLFDSGTADSFLYYVMPYVEGETLRDKLNREKQLGVDEAVRITREVADALDYAHRHGVIHRDIKPENILLHDGRPMVADFGIALALSAAAGGRMTETGLSLGTPHYMSPEQATAEKEITARSDVYSLASVLYEMLAGQPPHLGGSAQQIIMKIIAEPVAAVTSLRKSVPPNVAAALAQALEKLPADRFDSAKTFADALANPAFTTPVVGVAAGGATARGNRRLIGIAAVAAVAVVAALAGWLRPRPVEPTARFEVALPEGVALYQGLGLGSSIAVSRDGDLLAFIGSDSGSQPRIWLKRRGDLDARPIPGTEGAYTPFFSPDGSEIGYFIEVPRTLNVVAVVGGTPRTILGAGDTTWIGTRLGTSGASWASDGFIYYDADQSGIRRIRPDGSGRQDVLALDSTTGDWGFAWVEVLPGSDVLVARLRRESQPPDSFAIVASRIGSGSYTPIAKGVVARYHDGHLLVVGADGVLRVAPFDPRGLSLQGEGRVAATGVRVSGSFAGVDLAVDGRGTTWYVAGASVTGATLDWVDFEGRRTTADPTWFIPPGLEAVLPSRDAGKAVLVVRTDSVYSLWIRQLPAGPTVRLPMDSGQLVGGGWGADGGSLLVCYQRNDRTVMVRQRADGLGRPVTVADDTHCKGQVDESRDGRWIVTATDSASRDILVLERGRGDTFRPLVVNPANERFPVISPDGRWLAYQSDRSGRNEIYVQPFPRVDDGIWQVSIDGGFDPRWSPVGDRLFFGRPGGAILAVDMTPGPGFSRPYSVLTASQAAGLTQVFGWGIHRDGQRFLMVARVSGRGKLRLVRVEHLMAELNTMEGQ